MDSAAMFRMCRNGDGKNAIEINQLVAGVMNKVTISFSDFPHFIFTLKSLHNTLKSNAQQRVRKREHCECEDETTSKKMRNSEKSVVDDLPTQNREEYESITRMDDGMLLMVNDDDDDKQVVSKKMHNPEMSVVDDQTTSDLRSQNREQYNPTANYKMNDGMLLLPISDNSQVVDNSRKMYNPEMPVADDQETPDLRAQNHEQYNPTANYKMNDGMLLSINDNSQVVDNSIPPDADLVSFFEIDDIAAAATTMNKPLKERLLEITCYLFCQQYSTIVKKRCSGCLIGSPDPSMHDICRLPRKERIELIFRDVFNSISEEAIKRALGCDEYIAKDVLIKNSSWVRKLKNRIDRYL